MDPDHLDELEFLAMESPRSMIEIYRTDLIELIELAREALLTSSPRQSDWDSPDGV